MADDKTRAEELGRKAYSVGQEIKSINDAMSAFSKTIADLEAITNRTQEEEEKLVELTKVRKRLDDDLIKTKSKLLQVEAQHNALTEKEKKVYDKAKEDAGKEKKPFSWNNFKDAKGGAAGAVTSVISSVASAATDIYAATKKIELEEFKAQNDIYMKTIETQGGIFKRHMENFSKAMGGALRSSFASITQGVQEGAYAAASSSIDAGAEFYKQSLEDAFDIQKLKNYEEVRTKEKEKNILQEELNIAKAGVGAASGIISAFGSVGTIIGGLMDATMDATQKIMMTNSEVELEKLKATKEANEKELEMIKNVKSSAMDTAKQITQMVVDFTKEIENVAVKFDASTKSMANSLGLSGEAIDKYGAYIRNISHQMTFKDSSGKTRYLNASPEDLQKMQEGYINSSGRNVMLGQNDYLAMSKLGTVLGDQDLATSLLGDMHYFNQTIENSTDLTYKMFQTANKAGVSNKKFAKDFQENLKMAQKYTFKGGVEALAKMTIWSQKTRFNLKDVETVADKIMDGGIEGVLKMSSQLQVLGGKFAMMSDPLSMMYDALADPEALGKKLHEMVKGHGAFNKETGQVTFNTTDVQMLKAYANATGASYTDARAQVEQDIRNQQIDQNLKRKYNDAQLDILHSKAQYDTKTGQWMVTYNTKNKNGEDIAVNKSINDLTQADFDNLIPVEEQIDHKVGRILNLMEEQKNVTAYGQNLLADESFETMKQEINARMEENVRWMTQESDNLIEILKKSSAFVTEQNANQHTIVSATTDILDTSFSIIKKQSEKLQNDIKDAGGDLVLGLNAVLEELSGVKNGDALEALLKRLQINGQYNSERKFSDTLLYAAKNSETSIDTYKKIAAKYQENKNVGLSDLKDLLSDGYDDLIDAYENVNDGEKVDDYAANKIAKSIFDLFNNKEAFKEWSNVRSEHLTARAVNPFSEFKHAFSNNRVSSDEKKAFAQTMGGNYGSAQDAISLSNGKSQMISAAQIKSIHDGALARTDPMDTGIFAKAGGPFDTLFNGIFGKIDSVYGMFNTFIKPVMANHGETVRSKDPMQILREAFPQEIKLNTQPLKLDISGSIDLKSGGQIIDIMTMLKNNPDFVKQLTELIAYQFNSNANGGKSTLFPNRFTLGN